MKGEEHEGKAEKSEKVYKVTEEDLRGGWQGWGANQDQVTVQEGETWGLGFPSPWAGEGTDANSQTVPDLSLRALMGPQTLGPCSGPQEEEGPARLGGGRN